MIINVELGGISIQHQWNCIWSENPMPWATRQCININLWVFFSFLSIRVLSMQTGDSLLAFYFTFLGIEISVYMLQVHVMWATDPLAWGSEGVGLGTNKDI